MRTIFDLFVEGAKILTRSRIIIDGLGVIDNVEERDLQLAMVLLLIIKEAENAGLRRMVGDSSVLKAMVRTVPVIVLLDGKMVALGVINLVISPEGPKKNFSDLEEHLSITLV